MFADDGGSAITKQFIVMEQASSDGVFDGQHTDNGTVLFHVLEDILEGIATDKLEFFVGKEFMCCYVVERPGHSLYCYSFHIYIYISFYFVDFSLLLYSKNPTSFQKRDLLVLIFSTIKRMIMYLRLCIQIPASLYC